MSPIEITAAAVLGLPAAACAWAVARAIEDRLSPRAAVRLWRAARLAPFAPLLALAAAHLPALAPQRIAGVTGAVTAGAGPAPGPVFEPALQMLDTVRLAAPVELTGLVLALYAAGLAVMAVRALGRRRAVRRLLAASRPAGDALDAVAARWRRTLDLAPGAAPVRVIDAEISPFVAGLRPVIVAPASLAGAETAELVIAHELTHVRRGDERDRLIGEVLTMLAWFNPVTAAIERRLAGARELACDADVLERSEPGVRRAYARAIAESAPAQRGATAFLSDLPDLRRRRVAAALGQAPRKAGRAAAALSGALVLAAAIPSSALAAMLAGQAEERVREVSPRTLSEPIGQIVIDAQHAIDAGDLDAALALLDGAPEGDAYETSVIERIRANIHFQQGDIAAAVDGFEAALATGALLPEEEPLLKMNLVQLHAVLENYDRAAALIEALLADGFEPTPAQSKFFAQAYVQAGDPASALPFAEAFIAATERPSRSELLLLQYVYEQTGRTAEAEALAARVAGLDEN